MFDSLQETMNLVNWLLNEVNRLNSFLNSQNASTETIKLAAERHTDEEDLEQE